MYREWFNHITPETEKLPLDWAALDRLPFQKMLVVRSLRPDRIATALTNFIKVVMPDGDAYTGIELPVDHFMNETIAARLTHTKSVKLSHSPHTNPSSLKCRSQ